MSNFDHFVGTRPVSDKHAFDVDALAAWLATHLDGFKGPLTVEMFKGGQSNPTYKLLTPGQSGTEIIGGYGVSGQHGQGFMHLPVTHFWPVLQSGSSRHSTQV